MKRCLLLVLVSVAAAAAGLSIPEDLSVAGYDDHPIASVVAPPLTSVNWGLPDVAAGRSRKGAAAARTSHTSESGRYAAARAVEKTRPGRA